MYHTSLEEINSSKSLWGQSYQQNDKNNIRLLDVRTSSNHSILPVVNYFSTLHVMLGGRGGGVYSKGDVYGYIYCNVYLAC